jgi:alkylation response protein AidB-like acyl-CoA dehydrogenase
MWISNSGFADVFIVFAKIDGEKFTGFIVDARSKGISLGEEEDKLGIKVSPPDRFSSKMCRCRPKMCWALSERVTSSL